MTALKKLSIGIATAAMAAMPLFAFAQLPACTGAAGEVPGTTCTAAPATGGTGVNCAPGDTACLSGLSTAKDIGLSDKPITGTVTGIIKQFMLLLGIIAVVIILYGGYTWMMAKGEPAEVDKAKKIITQGLIGLVIIFLAYGIASFVISAISNASK